MKDIRVGDRVAMEPASKCRICADCKSGKYQVRVFWQRFPDCEMLTSPLPALRIHYLSIKAPCRWNTATILQASRRLYVQAARSSFSRGWCDGARFPKLSRKYNKLSSYDLPNKLEPLSVAVHAVSFQGQLRAGQNVVVFGAGPIGLLCMAVARALGAMEIIAVDIVPARLEFARDYAATATFLPPPQQQGERRMEYSRKAAATLKNAFELEDQGRTGIDLVIDATGAETCIQMAFLVAKKGGRFVQVRQRFTINGNYELNMRPQLRLASVLRKSRFPSPSFKLRS